MKKILTGILVSVQLVFGTQVQACDTGCSMGGAYLGILPQFHKNFAGIRWNTNQYKVTSPQTILVNGKLQVQNTTSTEQFNSLDIWGRFYPLNRVQIFAFVPYVFNKVQNGQTVTEIKGLGDISVLANYSIVNTGDSVQNTLKQTLLLGGGLKLPTGKFSNIQETENQVPDLQPGTGSLDFILNSVYTIRYKQTGINTDITYRVNTANKYDYQFGNRLNISGNVFYWQKAGSFSVLPNAGITLENAAQNSEYGKKIANSGNTSVFGTAGLSVYYKNLALGATYQAPVKTSGHQHQAVANARTMCQVSFMF